MTEQITTCPNCGLKPGSQYYCKKCPYIFKVDAYWSALRIREKRVIVLRLLSLISLGVVVFFLSGNSRIPRSGEYLFALMFTLCGSLSALASNIVWIDSEKMHKRIRSFEELGRASTQKKEHDKGLPRVLQERKISYSLVPTCGVFWEGLEVDL